MNGSKQNGSANKKFNTELTDYQETHADKTGPYADNLEVDALIVGAGFGTSLKSRDLSMTYLLRVHSSWSLHAEDPS